MEITHRLEDQTLVVSLAGRLDAASAPVLDKQMPALLEQAVHRVVIDLGRLEYISSAGLRSILALAKTAKAKGAKLVLGDLQEMVKEVFRISGFDRLITITDTVEAALMKT